MIENWNLLYKGFIVTDGKKSVEKLKGRTEFKSYDEVKDCESFGGILKDDVVLIDVDDLEQSEKLMNIVDDLQLDCKVYRTGRGRHFLFKNQGLSRNMTGTQLAIGLKADIKLGSRTSYEVLKVNNEERFCEWDIEDDIEDYQQLPKWLHPVRETVDFSSLGDGDGRNQTLFNYELTLQAAGFSIEECRECIRLINQYIIKEQLSDSELETILRDDAFQKPVFFSGSTLQIDKLAEYLKNTEHMIKINNQLYVYKDGVYMYDPVSLSSTMRKYIPGIKKSQKSEVLDCLTDITEEMKPSDARYIAFNNGILDIMTGDMLAFNPDMIITNKIPWDYNPDAYDRLADSALNKFACGDPNVRALLEECIGCCFYRRNVLSKAFILTGKRSNGKSTFLDCIKAILGNDNVSALDLKELDSRFSTQMMYGKLANIGDDIGDDFLQGSQIATFKKIVTGNTVKAERKGQDPFDFNPYCKLLFSANAIPRMSDKTGAVLRRLIIIPFNAVFDESDPDYDKFIIDKLTRPESIEYMIVLGVQGLKRVLDPKKGFTKSNTTSKAIEEYDQLNNTIKGFFAEQDPDFVFKGSVDDIYVNYQMYCNDCGVEPESKKTFGKSVVEMFGVESYPTTLAGKAVRKYRKICS